jgi:hypothetical protein
MYAQIGMAGEAQTYSKLEIKQQMNYFFHHHFLTDY